MIELYISSSVEISSKKIIDILSKKGVECLIVENYSSCQKKCNKISLALDLTVEKGFILKIFNISPLLFKTTVWNVLQPLLKLECAFVVCPDVYMGCVQNWPHVFRESACPYNPMK